MAADLRSAQAAHGCRQQHVPQVDGEAGKVRGYEDSEMTEAQGWIMIGLLILAVFLLMGKRRH